MLQPALLPGLWLQGWCLVEVRAAPQDISPSGEHEKGRNATPSLMTLAVVTCHARLSILAPKSSSRICVRGCRYQSNKAEPGASSGCCLSAPLLTLFFPLVPK